MKEAFGSGAFSRREFFGGSLALAGAGLLSGCVTGDGADRPTDNGKVIAGFDEIDPGTVSSVPWKPFSDRKVRVGIAGYGLCHFGGCFEFQHHPNVEIVAVAELFPDRRDALIKRLELDRPEKKGTFRIYDSCEDMIDKERNMDAVWIATDGASHASLVVRAHDRGFHTGSAVPALLGLEQLEEGWDEKMLAAVKKSGKVYAMFETSAFRHENYAARKLYEAGALGDIYYAEGEYYHYSSGEKGGLPSYTREFKDGEHEWRKALSPMYYPTHATAFYTCVTGKAFTEVSGFGVANPERTPFPQPNHYNNTFGSEGGLFRMANGGRARMNVFWDLPGVGGEIGRVLGTRGSYNMLNWDHKTVMKFCGVTKETIDAAARVDTDKPQLPPGVKAGQHGGSHGYLTDNFIRAILLGEKPVCDLVCALNTTVPGIICHKSALKGGETLKIKQYSWNT